MQHRWIIICLLVLGPMATVLAIHIQHGAKEKVAAQPLESSKTADDAKLHPSVVTLQTWWKAGSTGVQKSIAVDWDKAEVRRLSKQRCAYELGSLMKGMEFFRVTIVGDLNSFDGAGQCQSVTVPAQGNFTGYKAGDIVGCVDVEDNHILAVYVLPKE